MSDRSAIAEVAGALAAAAEAATPPEPEQLDFLPTRFAGGDAYSDQERGRQIERVRTNRAGRPAGSRNLATEKMLDFCRRTFGDPLMESFRWAQHTPESLARELGCTTLEAYDRLDTLRARLEKLFYATRAPVDGHGHTVVPVFAMSFGGHDQGADATPPWQRITEQNQALIEHAPQVSHGVVSHGDDK